MTDDSTPSPTPLAWARAARVIARGTPLFDVAAVLGVSIEEVEKKIAEDRHYAELIAFRKERRQAPIEKRLDTIREGLVDELEHALDTGSARGLGWMLREIRLGLQLTGLTGKVAEAARGGAAVFDWDKTQPDDEPGGPDHFGTHQERFLASLCDADYDDWLAAGRSPYPARKPPLPNNRVRWARARAAMRGEAVPAATPEELAGPDYRPVRILDELEEAIERAAEAGMAPSFIPAQAGTQASSVHPHEGGDYIPAKAGTHSASTTSPTPTIPVVSLSSGGLEPTRGGIHESGSPPLRGRTGRYIPTKVGNHPTHPHAGGDPVLHASAHLHLHPHEGGDPVLHTSAHLHLHPHAGGDPVHHTSAHLHPHGGGDPSTAPTSAPASASTKPRLPSSSGMDLQSDVVGERWRQAEANASPAAAPPSCPAAPPSYKQRMAELRERLKALIADPTPRTQDELELAEAVCSLRWPNWPPYDGPLDIFEIHDALVKLPRIHIDTLHRLAARPDYGPGMSRFRRPLQAQGP